MNEFFKWMYSLVLLTLSSNTHVLPSFLRKKIEHKQMCTATCPAPTATVVLTEKLIPHKVVPQTNYTFKKC